MAAGPKRERIAFEMHGAGAPDELGNVTVGDFAEQFQRAAEIRPKLGGEAVLAGRLQGKETVNITVRQDSQTRTVTTDWRARNVRTGVLYNIRSIIDPDMRRESLEMLAEIGVQT